MTHFTKTAFCIRRIWWKFIILSKNIKRPFFKIFKFPTKKVCDIILKNAYFQRYGWNSVVNDFCFSTCYFGLAKSCGAFEWVVCSEAESDYRDRDHHCPHFTPSRTDSHHSKPLSQSCSSQHQSAENNENSLEYRVESTFGILQFPLISRTLLCRQMRTSGIAIHRNLLARFIHFIYSRFRMWSMNALNLSCRIN